MMMLLLVVGLSLDDRDRAVLPGTVVAVDTVVAPEITTKPPFLFPPDNSSGCYRP